MSTVDKHPIYKYLPPESRMVAAALSFTIHDEMAQKGNSRQIVINRATLKPMLIKSKKALAWWHSATLQLRALGLLGTSLTPAFPTEVLRLTAHCYYVDERSDLDCSVLKDVLQSRYSGKGKKRFRCVAGVYENDRQVREEHYFHHIDAERPRVEVVIESLQALAP